MIDHFNLIAPLYDRVLGPPNTARWRDLLRLPTDGWMLDAGGGTGRVSSQLRPLVGQLVISDLSRRMLAQAQAKGNLWTVQTLVECLPFPEESFDRILVVDALHHFSDQRTAIREFLRLLKPGGRLVIEEPDINHFVVKLVAYAEKIALMQSHFYSPAEIKEMVEMVATPGLTARIESDGHFAAWVVVDKA